MGNVKKKIHIGTEHHHAPGGGSHVEPMLSVNEAVRKLDITELTYYRWRREYNRCRPNSSPAYKRMSPEAYAVENLFVKVIH